MKEYYSIQLEDEEAQALLDISLLTGEPVRSIPFLSDIDKAIENFDFKSKETFWYENYHVIGLYFYRTDLIELPENIGEMSYLRFIVINTSQIQTLLSNFKSPYQIYIFIYL